MLLITRARRQDRFTGWPCIFMCLLTAGTAAPASPQLADSCAAPEYHQFDFWIGRWRVTQGTVLAGTNRIERILGGCVLLENWQGAGGSRGRSFNTYVPARHVWHQTWVDNQGTLLLLEGGLRGDSMVLEGEQAGGPGQAGTRERITWTPLGGGTVRQHWESSSDQGATWKTAFDGVYRAAG